ncbi:unnamed protein product [Mytilus coruscus]|uniref:Uncharacterized protein n=1 Tax=Mytilus coruscus TaxID=42192 RepID=A0A6J8EAQ4_MYTCO|nr:unnamed protein product [Mytilus coruscus]
MILKNLLKANKIKTLEQKQYEILPLFLKAKNENRELQTIPPVEFDPLLANYLLTLRKKDGGEYEPSTLRSIVSSIVDADKTFETTISIAGAFIVTLSIIISCIGVKCCNSSSRNTIENDTDSEISLEQHIVEKVSMRKLQDRRKKERKTNQELYYEKGICQVKSKFR